MLAHQASLLVASTCSCRDKMQIPQKGCKSAFDVPLNKQCINCVQRSCDNEPLLRTKDLQRHGWTTVFTHLPFANLLDKQSAAEIKNMSACHCECAMHRSPENVREAKCLSTPLSQTGKHSFIVTLSVSRSRIALTPGSSAWVDGSSVLRTEKKTPPCWRWAWISSTSPMVPATASWYFCCMRVFSLSANVFSMPFLSYLQIGVLVGGNCACSTCSRPVREVRFWPMFTFCCRCDAFVLILLQDGPTLWLSPRWHSVDINRLSAYARERFFSLIVHCAFCGAHVLCGTSGRVSLQPHVFPLGFPYLKTNGLVVSTLKELMTFLRTCSLTSSRAPRRIHPQSLYVCPTLVYL